MSIQRGDLWSTIVFIIIILTNNECIIVVLGIRAYPDGCTIYPKDYYDYENLSFPPSFVNIKSTEQYWITKRLGTGKFSDVFEAIDIATTSTNLNSLDNEYYCNNNNKYDDGIESNKIVVLKCLKPIHPNKIKREILVMQRCQEMKVPNIGNILGIVIYNPSTNENSIQNSNNRITKKTKEKQSRITRNNLSQRITLVLEHAGENCSWLCHPIYNTSNDSEKKMKQKLYNNNNNNDDETYYTNKNLWLSSLEIKFFMYQLLRAVDGMHSVGIIHRDIKPRNILINRSSITNLQQRHHTVLVPDADADAEKGQLFEKIVSIPRSLVLIDFGLSDFYIPTTLYNVRVSSKYYKSPELLCNIKNYDYSIDMWSIGCILASLLFRTKDPFFALSTTESTWPNFNTNNPTTDKLHQLYNIVQILGIPKFLNFVDKYKVSFPEAIEQTLLLWKQQQKQRHDEQFKGTTNLDDDNESFLERIFNHCDVNVQSSTTATTRLLRDEQMVLDYNDGIDLIQKLLVYDPDERYTAKQAMEHSYFQQFHQ